MTDLYADAVDAADVEPDLEATPDFPDAPLPLIEVVDDEGERKLRLVPETADVIAAIDAELCVVAMSGGRRASRTVNRLRSSSSSRPCRPNPVSFLLTAGPWPRRARRPLLLSLTGQGSCRPARRLSWRAAPRGGSINRVRPLHPGLSKLRPARPAPKRPVPSPRPGPSAPRRGRVPLPWTGRRPCCAWGSPAWNLSKLVAATTASRAPLETSAC